ncbi:maleylacetate reductase [Exophiala viscosa]|uniref:Maleylacetate reductase n=1 Tax=Exophiala viscosa TaxID=2486360 RepID=A0AAN6IEZ4_9EURO|nr:maleylacetate reductase [Exophiala viscosa]KAI1621948.1 maleylacetate reductase [Exophiala viscosa]
MLHTLQPRPHILARPPIFKPTFTPRQPSRSIKMESSLHPLSGLYKPNQLKGLYYGPDVVKSHLLSVLPTSESKAFIITGSSLASKTPLIKDLESLLSKHHAGTFSNIKEHAPVAQLDEATDQVKKDSTIDTIISVGGGSPIDSAKAISYRVHETSDKWLLHITIPTTLSAAEATAIAGYTKSDGVKTGVSDPNIYPAYIFYDPKFGLHTPPHLLLSTGLRALDHAVESQYHPTTTWVPCRLVALSAISELFKLLPKYKSNPKDEDTITGLFLAAYASLGFLGQNMKGGLGLSHTLGYALGSPYGIPHGITSCMTLGHVVKLKAKQDNANAEEIAKILPYIGEKRTGDDLKDSELVGDKILGLVKDLGLKTTLTEKGVGKDQVDIICKRATGGLVPAKDDGPDDGTKKALKELVEGLY